MPFQKRNKKIKEEEKARDCAIEPILRRAKYNNKSKIEAKPYNATPFNHVLKRYFLTTPIKSNKRLFLLLSCSTQKTKQRVKRQKEIPESIAESRISKKNNFWKPRCRFAEANIFFENMKKNWKFVKYEI